jgi:dihydrofolate reductase
MKTQYFTASSLDGYIATEDHSREWLFQLGDVNQTSYPEFIKNVGALAMGASTYLWMIHHLIDLPGGDKGFWPYSQPTWVFSHRDLPTIPNANIHFVRGDIRPVHEQMKSAVDERNIWLVGGGDLVGQFFDADLLDEIIVQIGSVTLSKGQPLLPRQIAFPPLKLLSARAVGTGFAELHYLVPRRPVTP